MSVKEISLLAGDEVRITASGPTKVRIRSDEKLVDPIVFSAIAARDEEIERLLAKLREAEATIEDNVRADADAIIDRLIERLQ